MSHDTFDAWVTPVGIPLINLDHTFVACGSTYFGCWGSSDINHPNAAKVASGSGDDALYRAERYRGPFNSAWLGIYAINGVCHQSTNLFLFSVKNTCLPLDKPRPHGVLASHIFYSVYGTFAPGAVLFSIAYFGFWYLTVYLPAKTQCLLENGQIPNLTNDMLFEGMAEGSLQYKIAKNNYNPIPDGFTAETMVVNDMQVIIDHILQISQHPNFKTHMDIIKEKNRVLTQYALTQQEIKSKGISLTDSDIKTLVNSLNKLAVEFQDDLKTQIGTEAYIRLNGDDQFYTPVDPEIAVRVMRQEPSKE